MNTQPAWAPYVLASMSSSDRTVPEGVNSKEAPLSDVPLIADSEAVFSTDTELHTQDLETGPHPIRYQLISFAQAVNEQ